MCTSPITIHYESIEGNHAIQVPCGKCAECLKTKQNDYMVRIYEEMMQVNKSCFVTLTYAPANVPYFLYEGKKYLTVWKKDITDWLKRLRTNYERKTGKTGLRFFLCSEYGPKTHRPHYHAIFFGVNHDEIKFALTDWNNRFGFYQAKDVDYSNRASLERSARYVAKYSCKGVFDSPFRESWESLSDFPKIQQRTGLDLHSENEILPFVFLLSSLKGLRDFEAIIKPFSWKIFRGLFGRGAETEMCEDRKF